MGERMKKVHNERGAGRKPALWGKSKLMSIPILMEEDIKKQVQEFKDNFTKEGKNNA